MKLNKVNLGIICASLLVGVQGFSQNSNVVSAALEFQKYEPAFAKQDLTKAKSYLLEAKSYIDPAMKDETTKADPKANYYNAVINYSLVELSGMTGAEDLKVYQNDSILGVIEKSIKHTEAKK